MINPIEYVKEIAAGGAAAIGAGIFFYIAVNKAPALLVNRIHRLIGVIRNSPWLRDPLRPKRLKLFVAFLEWAEEEIPEPGTNRAFYDLAGAALASHLPLLLNNQKKWADALEQGGNALDTELDADIAAEQKPPTV